MFKRCLLTLMLSGSLVVAAAPGFSQDNSASGQQAPPQGEAGHPHGRFDPAKRTEMLTKQLNLTSDQQPKVLDILKSEQSQMESLHSDTSLSQEDRRSKMMDIHKTSSDQIRGLLDANQQKKWDEMQSKREQWQGHHPPSDSSKQN
jgi:periplasmic protein CpxP/Spy